MVFDDKAIIISSDGHASARMRDYRPYIDASHLEEFDAFCPVYEKLGSRNFDPPALLGRLDPEVVEVWVRDVLKPGRAEGDWDPQRRLVELEREGVAGEVIFPDFGLPFELYPPIMATRLGYPLRTQEQIDVANRAYNRWLADFCSTAPARFAGMAVVSFADVDAAVQEIRWAKNAGLRGLVLPMFPEAEPVFDARYDPIWSTLTDLDMPVNSHPAISSVSDRRMPVPQFPHPACSFRIIGERLISLCHEMLGQLIWGGVLERHPNLKVAFTEQGSGWVVAKLKDYDYAYEGSYLRRDIRAVVPRKPSEYFERQCFMGSSMLTLAETEARHEIGVDKMMFGVDYPHHEGTIGVSTLDYLQATLGAAEVPPDEARMLLGGNAGELWGFEMDELEVIAEPFGLRLSDILTPPTEDKYPRGDVHKPL